MPLSAKTYLICTVQLKYTNVNYNVTYVFSFMDELHNKCSVNHFYGILRASDKVPGDSVRMTEQAPANVGQRIRSLREERSLSLRALSEQCGLSVNAISRIERGENSPTVSSLHQLATALEVPITDFFTEETPQVTVFVKRDRRPGSSAKGLLLESLGSGLPNQQLEPFMLTLDPGTESLADGVTHPGEEFVHCLEGEVEYQVGDQVYWLEAGDSLLFQAEQPHKCVNATQAPAVVLLVFEAANGRHLGWEHHLE